ncbi:hypothetical protein [Galbibacter orientalis]|uniref:hypothetical protein n=1 Tax=Galbibacter orientalis TaxID=453852 RepID=UPI00307FEACB
MDQNALNIIKEIKEVSSNIIEKDVTEIRGFNERQVEAIAKQAIIIQRGVANGDIDEDLKEFFFDGLEAMALNFVNTLKGILSVTIEKVWNAIVDVLWKAIDSIK